MKKILIYKHIIKNGEYDIGRPIDYGHLQDTVSENYSGVSPNWANRLWLQGLFSELQCECNSYSFLSESMTADFINHNFDLIILPMANIFWVGYQKQMIVLADVFEKIKIPTYVIACGVQADSYSDLELLVNQLKTPATRFMSAIYNTGGEFALRGYFTKQFFDKLGFKSAVVTGCPSLYQNGSNFSVSCPTGIGPEGFKPALNGCIDGISDYIAKYPSAEFFDQCNYFELCFSDKAWSGKISRDLKFLIRKYGYDAVKLASERKIQLFPEMNDWRNYLISGKFNFSYGSRIHGNIISILSGLPAIVWAKDSRTREMAEFYDIPYTLNPISDLYEAFQNIDYSSFNQNYKIHYDAFERFLISHDIVDRINENNLFWNNSDTLDSYAEARITVDPAYAAYLAKNKMLIKAKAYTDEMLNKLVSRFQ